MKVRQTAGHGAQFQNVMRPLWFSKSCFKINCHNNNAVLRYWDCILISITFFQLSERQGSSFFFLEIL